MYIYIYIYGALANIMRLTPREDPALILISREKVAIIIIFITKLYYDSIVTIINHNFYYDRSLEVENDPLLKSLLALRNWL